MALLEVKDLRVQFDTDDGVVKAVDGVNFSLDPGQTLGIVGESGSGKSVTNLAIMGLARGGRITGEVLFEGRDLLKMHINELRAIRGKKIAMIFQDPLSSLHPYYKVGSQIAEMILAHEKVSKKEARDRAIKLLRLVGIPRPERRVDDYPHQFSGGMRQRAMIAMALALDPAVLIADEPTTALDVTVQAQVLDLIERLQEEFGTAIICITHDLGVVADMADDVLVMYGGKPVEVADRRTAYYNPHMPYTWGLLQSLPPVASRAHRRAAPPDQGPAAEPDQPAQGLLVQPPLPVRHGGLHQGRARAGAGRPGHALAPVRLPPVPGGQGAHLAAGGGTHTMSEPLVKVTGVKKYFPITQGIIFQREVGRVHAVDGVDLEVQPGETLGIVGETGCGKSTLARLICRLLPVTEGTIEFDGQDITNLKGNQLRQLRREIQMIFQDPYSSLNPRKRVGAIIGDPFEIHKPGRRQGAEEAGPGADGDRRPQPRALQPVPGRVLRRPAPAHRGGPRPGPAAQADHLRRAGVGPRRLHPGPGHQPAGGPPERVQADLRLHRPRPVGGAATSRTGSG